MTSRMFRYCSVVILLFLASCSTMLNHSIPMGDSFDKTSNKYYITLKNGGVYTANTIRSHHDTVLFRDTAVQRSDIQAIQEKKFSLGKTIGLAALFYLSLAVITPMYLIYLMNDV